MWNMVIRFILIALLAAGAVWLAERPGTLTFDWLGYTVEISIMVALILIVLTLFVIITVWTLIRQVFNIPGALSGFFSKRKRETVHEALTKGIIAVGAGDSAEATKYARKASSLAGDDPLAQLLKAQAAQLRGDQSTVTHVFEAMAQAKDTEALGLRGLFTQARQDGDMEKARAMALKALELNSGLVWASKAMLAFQSAGGEWPAVGTTLDNQRTAGILSKDEESRLQAVVQTARAIELEEANPDEALSLAERALRAAPDLVPAAVVAGRILSSQQSIRKAARLLEKTWKLVPHPDVAEVYAFLRAGDSPQDRQKRIKTLTNKHGGGIEGAIALAIACIDAQDWKDARAALAPYSEDRPPVRVCALMAEIEQGEFGDKGRAREWLSRAVRAPRDPAWVADGHVSKVWLPVSPITGELDAFEWQVPQETLTHAEPERSVAEADVVEEPGTPDQAPPAETIEVEPGSEENKDPEPQDGAASPDQEPADEAVIEAEPVSEEKTDTSANGAQKPPKEQTPEPAATSDDPVDMQRPDDPGPPAPDESQNEASKPWYQGMFSR